MSRAGGKRSNQTGRPKGAMNKDKARPYFATIKNAILKKNASWIEEIEYTLAVLNDPNAGDERRDAARDTLLNMTYHKPAPAETQPAEQLGFNLQWGQPKPGEFDPAVHATQMAGDSSQVN